MTDQKVNDGDAVLGTIRAALHSDTPQLRLVRTFTHGMAVQVYAGKPAKKVGPLIFPADGGTLADTLQMLGTLALEEASR